MSAPVASPPWFVSVNVCVADSSVPTCPKSNVAGLAASWAGGGGVAPIRYGWFCPETTTCPPVPSSAARVMVPAPDSLQKRLSVVTATPDGTPASVTRALASVPSRLDRQIDWSPTVAQ